MFTTESSGEGECGGDAVIVAGWLVKLKEELGSRSLGWGGCLVEDV